MEGTTIQTGERTKGYVLQPGEGRILEPLGLRILAGNAVTGGRAWVGECVNGGPGGPPLHTHRDHDEFYLVLEGRYRFKIGEDTYEGGPGTFAYVPRGTMHTFASVGKERGRLFAVTMPGLEQFLERMADMSARGVEQMEMANLFADYQSEINGPGLVQR